MAAVLDLAALTQRHETVSGPSFAVTCGTEAWDIVHLHKPPYDLVQCTVVNDVKLFGFLIIRLWFTVTADTGLGTAADLGDTKVEDTFPRLLALAGGDNHAGVRNGDPDTGNDLRKSIVVDSVCKGRSIDIVCIAESW